MVGFGCPPRDKAEGVDKGYRKATVDVVTGDGKQKAAVYIATDKDRSVRPYDWYKAYVVRGAREHGLPDDYVQWLEKIESQPDTNEVRRAKHERLLFGDS